MRTYKCATVYHTDIELGTQNLEELELEPRIQSLAPRSDRAQST